MRRGPDPSGIDSKPSPRLSKQEPILKKGTSEHLMKEKKRSLSHVPFWMSGIQSHPSNPKRVCPSQREVPMQPWQQAQQAHQQAHRVHQQAHQQAQQAHQQAAHRAAQQPLMRQQQWGSHQTFSSRPRSVVGGCVLTLFWIAFVAVVVVLIYAFLTNPPFGF